MNLLDKILESPNSWDKEELNSFCKNSKIVLYGAGLTGKTILKELQKNGINPLFVADDTVLKEGTFIEGVIIKPLLAVKEIKEPYALIVTMMNPQMDFYSLRASLNNNGIKHVFSFLEFSFLFPDNLLPYFHFDKKENLIKDKENMIKSLALFSDELSQNIFFKNIQFRLTLDFSVIPIGDKDDYFPDSLIKISDNCIFFDCGAFDGDTIKSFLKRKQNFDKVYAFEPDSESFNKLINYCAGLDRKTSKNIFVFNNGLGAGHNFLKFNSLSNMASSINEDGNVIIQTFDLDEFFLPMLLDYTGSIFLKMDIEGAEPDALKGCKELIEKKAPYMAISIYHNPNDLWNIPLYIKSVNANYTFYLRQHGNDSMDLVLYAFPTN